VLVFTPTLKSNSLHKHNIKLGVLTRKTSTELVVTYLQCINKELTLAILRTNPAGGTMDEALKRRRSDNQTSSFALSSDLKFL